MAEKTTFELIVVRHADAEKVGYDRDFERSITDYGRKQIDVAKVRLKKIYQPSSVIVVSAALRAKQTFAGFDLPAPKKLIETKDLYEIEVDDFRKWVKKNDLGKPKCVIIFGHNPFMSDICSELSGENIKMGTCDMCHLKVEAESFVEAIQMDACWTVKPI